MLISIAPFSLAELNGVTRLERLPEKVRLFGVSIAAGAERFRLLQQN